MENNIFTGIDIGSRNLKFMSISFDPETNKTKTIAKESYLLHGVSKGYISNPDLFHQSFQENIYKYQKTYNLNITEAIFTIDSFGEKSHNLKLAHNTANQVNISEVDLDEIERKINLLAKKTIREHILLKEIMKYTINGYEYFSDILGLDGKKIESEYIYVTIPENHIVSLEKILFKNNIDILDLQSGAFISSKVNLNQEDKNLGVLSLDIGAQNTSVTVWENSKLIYLDLIDFGSDNITKQISLEKKISFSEAEKFKTNSTKQDKNIQKIIINEYTKLAKKIKAVLIDLERNELLPAGIVLSGGGSRNENINIILRDILRMPVKRYQKNISTDKTDFNNNYTSIINFLQSQKRSSFNFKEIWNNILKLFKNL